MGLVVTLWIRFLAVYFLVFLGRLWKEMYCPFLLWKTLNDSELVLPGYNIA